MNCVRTDEAQHRDAGDEYRVGQTGDLREAAAAESTDGEHEELHEHEACEEGVGHIGVLGEQLRSRSQSLDDEAAHQDRGDGFAGDTEGQHRDQGAAGVAALLPQAHSANTMHRARISARYFFIFVFLLKDSAFMALYLRSTGALSPCQLLLL